MGTLELLLTAPVRDWELIVGKWLGSLGFMTALLAVSWVYPLILHQMADPGIDQGLLVSAYLGLFLLTACMLALGVFISSLFDNPLPAFFATLGLLLGLWILGGLGSGSGPWSELAAYLGLVDHFYDNLYRGVLSLTDIIYYLSVTILALFVGAQVIQARRWR